MLKISATESAKREEYVFPQKMEKRRSIDLVGETLGYVCLR